MGESAVENTNTDPTAQSLEAFRAFTGQAVVGVGMACFRRTGSFAPLKTMGQALLASYLNDCWMSLLKDDDEFVTRSFQGMCHRSPVCLVHKVMGVGSQLIMSVVANVVADGPHTDAAYIDGLREFLSGVIE